MIVANKKKDRNTLHCHDEICVCCAVDESWTIEGAKQKDQKRDRLCLKTSC